jgi:hypothetical protein
MWHATRWFYLRRHLPAFAKCKHFDTSPVSRHGCVAAAAAVSRLGIPDEEIEMRAEAQNYADSIKQALDLLRRFL